MGEWNTGHTVGQHRTGGHRQSHFIVPRRAKSETDVRPCRGGGLSDGGTGDGNQLVVTLCHRCAPVRREHEHGMVFRTEHIQSMMRDRGAQHRVLGSHGLFVGARRQDGRWVDHTTRSKGQGA